METSEPAAKPALDADALPGRDVERGEHAALRLEVVRRVLGVEPDLDRVPARLGAPDVEVGQRGALGHRELQRDQVDAEDLLGHRVLDLEPGVHLQEEEPLGLRVVEELDRAGADVADRRGRDAGRVVQCSGHLGGEVGRGRLLDHLLVAPLDRAVAFAEHEDVAVPVADDLHLDVAAALDVRLDEDGAVAERAGRLVAGAADLGVERREVADDPHAATTATSRRLHDERGGRRPSAPRERLSTGTPASRMIRFASTLEPIASIDSGDGPTQVSPAASTARANSAFSERKP